jgi:hypothetical protein
MANLALAGVATNVSDTELSFNIGTASNLLIAVFVASSTSQDTVEPTSPINDSLGNAWNLIQWSAESGDQPAVAVFALPPIPSIATGIATLDMPASMIPGDSVSTAVLGWLFSSKFANIVLDSFTASVMTVRPVDHAVLGSAIITQTGTDDLVIGLTWSSLATGAFSTGNFTGGGSFNEAEGLATNNNAANGFLLWGSWLEATSGPNTYATDFFVSPAADVPNFSYVFGMSFSLSGPINGGSGNSTRAFFLSRAPEPRPSVPSRFIATIQIDATQMQFKPFATTPCQFPEFTWPPNGGTAIPLYGWSVLEFDLEHIGNSGAGMDQVRKLIAHSRPSFGLSADALESGTPPEDGAISTEQATYALLTNTTTLQTEVLGGAAIMLAQTAGVDSGYFFEKLHCAFPGHKGGMKYRFLALSKNAQGTGIYTLNFLNYDDGQGSLNYAGCLVTGD